jgi:copper transport protein
VTPAVPASLPRGRSVARAVLAAGAAAVLLLLGASPASAHATLLSVDPADGILLAAAPAAITLTFNEPCRSGTAGSAYLMPRGPSNR